MPDTRKHRGPHPEDAALFAPENQPGLIRAVAHLSWLLERDYAIPSALKLVGDRFQLTARQRVAVRRCACSDRALAGRQARRVEAAALAGAALAIDGYNVITTVEAALGGAVILIGRDGCCRDLVGLHGSYRKVEETRPAIEHIGECLESTQVDFCRWLLDQPVSNSGRLKSLLCEIAATRGWAWEVELVPDPDPILSAGGQCVATADSVILDRCATWFNLAPAVVDRAVPGCFRINLGSKEDTA